jgi:hypothetical protein
MAPGCHASQAIVAMKGRSIMEWTAKWVRGTLGDYRPGWWGEHSEDTTCIGCRYLYRHIPGHRRDQLDLQFR